MIDILVQFFTLLGLSAWLPAPAERGQWLGARFMLAGYVATIFLFVGNVVFSLPVSSLTLALVVLGFVGLVCAVARATNRAHLRELWHPLYVFTILLLAIAAYRGGLEYQPYLGDEFASWLNLTKQIYLADNYWSPLMDYHLPSYSNGWPLLIAASSSVYPSYDDAHAVPMQFFLHLGVIGFTYDAIRVEYFKTDTNDRWLVRFVAWGVILVMLSAEVTWRLLPTDLLIEQPMLYTYSACFLIAVMSQNDETDHLRLSLYLGIVLCAGYLFKVSILAIAPAFGVFFLAFHWRDFRRKQSAASRRLLLSREHWPAVLSLLLMFAPTIAAIIIWKHASTGDQLDASLGSLTGANWSLLFSDYGFSVLKHMTVALWDFGATYKIPLTLCALTAFVVATPSKHWAPIILGFWAFCGATAAGLYLYYIYRAPMPASGFLESFPRFVILPIRILHYIGFLIITFAALRFIAPWVAAFVPRAVLVGGLAVAIGCGFVWQVVQVDRAVVDIADRRFQDSVNIRAIQAYKLDISRLKKEIRSQSMTAPRVAILDSHGYKVASTVALYYSLKTERGAPYRYFWPEEVPAHIEQAWSSFDIIWPVTIDDYSHRILRLLIDDPACANSPTDYFLLRSVNKRYACVIKDRIQ